MLSPTQSAPSSPSPPTKADQEAFAQALGLEVTHLGELENAFSDVLAPLGFEGKTVFNHLIKGQSLAQALELPKGTADLLYARAHQWASTGHFDKATLIFRALCILEGTVPDYWVGYAICLLKQNDKAQAEQALLTAAQIKPSWALPYYYLLDLYLHHQKLERAEAALAAFDARLGPDIPAEIRAQAERFRLAISIRQQAKAQDPLVKGGPKK